MESLAIWTKTVKIIQFACNISKVCWFSEENEKYSAFETKSEEEREEGMAFSSAKWVKLREGARLNFGFTLGWEDEWLNILTQKNEEELEEGMNRVLQEKGREREISLPWLAWVLVLPSSSACWDCRFRYHHYPLGSSYPLSVDVLVAVA